MPLFTVRMKSNGSTNQKDRLSRAIDDASIAAGYSERDVEGECLARTGPLRGSEYHLRPWNTALRN
jgi:hypothetical protein